MRLLLAITIASSAFVSFAIVPREDLPKALANRNTEGAGAMSNGVLAVALEAKQSLWYPYGENHAGVSNAAFAEEGKAPSVPGPLIHVASLPHVNVLEGRTRGQLDFSLSFAKTEPSIRFDGVAGVSGSGAHLAPLIAPRDSFEVRFTPPRAGTFMYHSHVDEVRQHAAGLAGALIVREPGSVQQPPDDYVFFLKGSRQPNAASTLEVNGRSKPDTIVIRLGHPARLRFMSLASINPTATVSLTTRTDSALTNTKDANIVVWRALAKDGADLPQAERSDRLAQQVVSMGETFDFEYQPSTKGPMRLEVRGYGVNGTLLATVPIVVR